MRIIWDLDGVLCNTYETFCVFLEDHHGIKAIKDQKGMFEDRFGITSKQVKELFDDFYKHDQELLCPTMSYARDVVSELARRHEQYIVTARPKHTRENTKFWVYGRLGLSIDGVFVVSGADKGKFGQAIGADLAIDDMPHHALEYKDAGIDVLLYDAPYNQHQEGIGRVLSLHDVVRYVNKW